MSAQRLIQVSEFAEVLKATDHGQRGALVAQACQTLNLSRGQFYRSLGDVLPRERKRRTDAGAVELPREEAALISAYMMEGYRHNAKKMVSLETAVECLRANDVIRAARLDTDTGELVPLSLSTISRALYAYTLHPKQLRRPTPHIKLKSLHPNHVWQVDGSVCVLFYLPGAGAAVVEIDEAVHYKNKPENLKAIEQCRVIRYVMTDHCTDVTLWRYYPHAETAAHTVHFLAWAMAPKADPRQFPVQGRPQILMVDPGATSGGLVKRFCDRLGIELIVNERRRPRAKGSVEKGNDRVETAFEQGLRFARMQARSFEDLNTVSERFMLHYNATKKHSRHGMARFEAWMHIRAEHLVTTGPEKTLLALATHEPETRTVNGNLCISFKGRTWNVSDVPGVLVGGKVRVHWHPFITNTAMAITEDADGREIHHQLADVTGDVDPYANEWGFQKDAAVINEERKSRPDTLADTHRKEMARLASGETTQEAADKKRERKDYVPFDGRIDPYKEAKEADLPTYLPKKGVALEATAPQVEYLKLPHSQAAMRLVKALGRSLSKEEREWMAARWPDGVPEDAISGLVAQLDQASPVAAQTPKPVLKSV